MVYLRLVGIIFSYTMSTLAEELDLKAYFMKRVFSTIQKEFYKIL